MDLYEYNQKDLKIALSKQNNTCHILFDIINSSIQKVKKDPPFSIEEEKRTILRCSKQLERELSKLSQICREIIE